MSVEIHHPITMEIIEKLTRDYRVQSESARSFRVTIPKKFSDISGIKKGDKLGFRLNISNNYGTIDIHTNPSNNMTIREVSGSNHLLRIPAPIGSAMQIRRDLFNWILYKKDKEYILRMNTPYIPLMISESTWNHLKEYKLKQTKYDEESSFSIYVDKDMRKELNWDQNTNIGFLISQNNGKLAIRCQPNNDNNEIFTTSVNRVNSEKEQLRFYIPRSIIRSLDIANDKLNLLSKNNALALVKE
jgi:hypothetical protein